MVELSLRLEGRESLVVEPRLFSLVECRGFSLVVEPLAISLAESEPRMEASDLLGERECFLISGDTGVTVIRR